MPINNFQIDFSTNKFCKNKNYMKRHKKSLNSRFKLTHTRNLIKATVNYELGFIDGIIKL